MLSYLKKILTKIRSKKKTWEESLQEFNDGMNPARQEWEDYSYERDIRITAEDMIAQYKALPDYIRNGKVIGKLGMVLPRTNRIFYYVHDEKTAKYLNADFISLVKEEYNKLIKNEL